MLKLQLSRESGKFLDILPPKQFHQVVKKIFSLLTDPRPNDTKELKGYPFLRCDIGEYRIVYDVSEEVLRVIVVGKRNDDEVYKGLK
ncbi:MAG: type II toxin-antitoxin system RelE/ParE family toxin [Desulfuromonadaceae bacterium]|nr:type II toxin-antitoxin system RelE/ParE family toxin [Desulfuromonadaceae bacterium]MDD5104771.1 type II toxin-antitoxin system RelE/ParE family toxin [Desulfuromonadaceae bacterium]